MSKIKRLFKIIKENIFTILIIVTLTYTACTIKYSPKGTIELAYQYIAICLIGIIIIIKSIIKKQAILTNKLDFCILGLTIASAVPIILQRAVSIDDSIFIFNQYIMLLEFYIIIKQLCIEQPKTKNVLINVSILLTIMLIFIGIDKMTVNILGNDNRELTRLESIFYSPNALATLIGGTIFIAFGQLLQTENKKLKIFYFVELSILILGLVLTYSRIMYVTLAMVIILYYIFNKDKKQKQELIVTAIIMILCGMVYSKVYSETLLSGQYYKIWIGILINAIITTGLCKIAIKNIEKIKKINAQKSIIVLTTLIALVGIYFFSVRKISKPLVVFDAKSSYSKVEKNVYNVQGDYKYLLQFDIESHAKKDDDYKMVIVERDKYMDYIKGTDVFFGEFSGIKEVEITTDKATTSFSIEIESRNPSAESYFKINKLLLNDQEAILNYKYLPTGMMDRFSSGIIKSKNAWERVTFYKDALKIMKENGNWIFGIGGNGWRYKYLEVQSYAYKSKDVHNYPLQIWLEFGVLGLGIFIAIIVILIKNMITAIKNEDISSISILCAIGCMLFHSCFDYSMAFFYIMIIMYLLLAFTSTNKSDKRELTIKDEIINSAIYIITLVTFLYNFVYGVYIINATTIIEKGKEERVKIYERLVKIFPYDIKIRENILTQTSDRKTKIENYKYLFDKEAYYIAEYDFLAYNIDDYINECLNEGGNIEDLIKIKEEYFYKTRNVNKFKTRYQINRLYQLINIGCLIEDYNKNVNNKELSELSNSIYIEAQNELNEKKKYMLDAEKGRYDKANIESFQKEIDDIQIAINEKIQKANSD